MPSGTTTKKSRHQMPGKGRKKKAAELCGFAAWYVREWIFGLIQRIICPVPVILTI